MMWLPFGDCESHAGEVEKCLPEESASISLDAKEGTDAPEGNKPIYCMKLPAWFTAIVNERIKAFENDQNQAVNG